jgi:hypothetical protein
MSLRRNIFYYFKNDCWPQSVKIVKQNITWTIFTLYTSLKILINFSEGVVASTTGYMVVMGDRPLTFLEEGSAMFYYEPDIFSHETKSVFYMKSNFTKIYCWKRLFSASFRFW